MKYSIKSYSQAYLLPATILLGLAIAIIGGVFLRFTAISSQVLNQQNYNAIAEEAARSGIAFADSCLSQGQSWTTDSLKPNTTCTGASSAGSAYVTVNGTEWRSKFSVAPANAQNIVVSTGTVEVVNSSGVKLATYEKKLSMSLTNAFEERDTSTGQSITAIKNDKTDCAIANGKLYCWGGNSNGQVGDGTKTDKAVPTLVQGELAGKTVTKVSVSDSSVCAIADGMPYCWGGNNVHQLGNDQGGWTPLADQTQPRANFPKTSSGPLNAQYVTDIGTASYNNPAGLIWVFANSFQHSCALTANGSVSCWGYGQYRQLTGGACIPLPLNPNYLLPIPGIYCIYPDYDEPTLVKGYSDNTGDFAGKKAIRVGASSHDSCLVAEGTMYCWGVPAPLFAGLQALCSTYTGMFSAANTTLWVANLCIMSYTNSYDATNSPGSAAAGTFLDHATWDVSTNEGCWMANRNFYCFGTTPAFGLFWLDSFRAPWVALPNSNVTDSDNGEYSDSGGTLGLYCVIDAGIGKCAGNPGNSSTGTGVIPSWYQQLRPLITTTGLDGQTATKIAAGRSHGCVVANGRLYCWGDASHGVLANGTTSGRLDTPTRTGTTIGTQGANEFAAHDSVSVGEEHSCGIANGKLFCWGGNDKGQLGMGNTSEVDQPRAVSSSSSSPLLSKNVTKVSAGKNHTCAIANGDLYCWGDNTNGQLGIGTTGGFETIPKPVTSFGITGTGVRITDVSAGDTSTCAIANATAYCWGNNSYGQLGTGDYTNYNAPKKTSNPLIGKSITAITMGVTHACAIANADLYCWGDNGNGKLGTGNYTSYNAPQLINTGTANSPRGPNNVLPSVSAVSAGSDFTCAIINATVSCWGNNANGRTGQNTTAATDTLTPTALKGAAGGYYATSISAGSSHACALLNGGSSKTNGNMYCWGDGGDGRLGYNATTARSSASVAIISGDMNESGEIRSATAISAGAKTSCAIANAVILCWGDGSSGQLGTGSPPTANSLTPLKTTVYQVPSSSYALGPIF